MYNEELKTRFILQYTYSVSMRIVAEGTFNIFEPYEVKWGADLCTRSAEDLQVVIDSMFGVRVKSQSNRIIILKQYVMWCIAQGVEGACDGMLKISSPGVEAIKSQMVSSPLHLQRYLDSFLLPTSAKTVDDTYRCYFWLAFAGCEEEDIINMKTSDVDFENMVVHVRNEEFPIYREGLPAIRNCANQQWFTYIHPNYSKDIIRLRVDGDQLLRGVKAEATALVLRATLSRAVTKAVKEGKTNCKLSHYKAQLSGIFYRTYEMELAGAEPDFMWLAKKVMYGKTYKLDSGRNLIGAKERAKAKDYLEDYNRWKLAFIK